MLQTASSLNIVPGKKNNQQNQEKTPKQTNQKNTNTSNTGISFDILKFKIKALPLISESLYRDKAQQIKAAFNKRFWDYRPYLGVLGKDFYIPNSFVSTSEPNSIVMLIIKFTFMRKQDLLPPALLSSAALMPQKGELSYSSWLVEVIH